MTEEERRERERQKVRRTKKIEVTMVHQDGIRKINEDAQRIGMCLASNHDARSRARRMREGPVARRSSDLDQWKMFPFM